MTKVDQKKYDAINNIRALCQHCQAGEVHECPVSRVIAQIEGLHGIPIIVNDELHHVIFS